MSGRARSWTGCFQLRIFHESLMLWDISRLLGPFSTWACPSLMEKLSGRVAADPARSSHRQWEQAGSAMCTGDTPEKPCHIPNTETLQGLLQAGPIPRFFPFWDHGGQEKWNGDGRMDEICPWGESVPRSPALREIPARALQPGKGEGE